MWPECVGSSRMMKALMPLTGPHIPLNYIQLSTYGTLCIMYPTPPSTSTDCPGAQWCPDAGLGGGHSGHHPATHQEHALTFSEAIHTGRVYYTTTVLSAFTLSDPAELSVLKVPGWRWSLRALSGRHLGYVAEEEEPFWQLFTRRARLFWQV